MVDLSPQQATIAAALVAALVALSALVTNLIGQRIGEARAAHRKALEPFIADLGVAIYGVIATSRTWVRLRTSQPKALAKWECRLRRHKKQLSALRPKVRYTLWGLDEPLRVLIRVPDWLKHVRKDEARLAELVKLGTALREAVDRAIRASYASGNPPSWRWRFVAGRRAKAVRRVFESGPGIKSRRAPQNNKEMRLTRSAHGQAGCGPRS